MALDAARYRQLIGHFATGVTVITTAVDGMLHGMTANAITSVSLDPLLLLVCVDKTAHTHGQLLANPFFTVNILSVSQEGVSRLFAEKGPPEKGTLRGVPFRQGANGVPVLSEAVAYIECAISDQWDAGDHTIFIASVSDGAIENDVAPLIFFRGGYRRLEE
jgi:flavin reductase (DIM6/NTAB) family NADH-FMN oxidoreductase RutF